MSKILEIVDLKVNVIEDEEEKEILRGVHLDINKGEVHAVMGPNGSGKSTLSNVLMGHPKYKITQGKIFFMGKLINDLPTDERARLGMFLSFQYPTSLPGVTVGNFLKTILKSIRGKDIRPKEFRKELQQKMQTLDIDQSFISRYVNDGFSGGEKKRSEILQMNLIKPILSILDETDSGLDIDALRIVSQAINQNKNQENTILMITHYQRILNYVKPDFVHVFADGKIKKTGNNELSREIEERGYDWILKNK